MIGAARAAGAFRNISGDALLIGLMAIFLAIAIGFSALVMAGAARSNRDFAQTVETRLLWLLEREGLSGLVAEIDRLEGALVPGTGTVDFVVWRRVGGTTTTVRETTPGLADAVADVGPGAPATRVMGDRTFKVFSPDVAAVSAAWDLPMSDVSVSYAIDAPTPTTRGARRELAAVWAGLVLAMAVGLVFHFDHRRRYRAGLDRINDILDTFAAGDTSAQVSIETSAPELRRLSDHLCIVLPRFDRLLGDLRALTAHLAHELKTPLQTIRSDVYRLAASDDAGTRRGIAGEIDVTIDATDARLRSVMQLFRLSADVRVPLTPGVELGPLVADQVDDFEFFLIAHDRELRLDIAEDVFVTANPPLLELLLANLLSNADRYAPPDARIGVDLVSEGERFRLSVWNTGSAFPDDWLGRPIQRLSRSESHDDIPGHGLGLALVDAIARHHAFNVKVANSTDPETGLGRAEVIVTGPCDVTG